MNIQATLDKCRAELKRQQGVKQYQRSWSEKARLKVAEDALREVSVCHSSHDAMPALTIHALKQAAVLLGVEVVE